MPGGHHLQANRSQGNQRQLDVLDAKGDADNRDETGQCRSEVANRQPPARQHKPDHVADQPQRSGAEIHLSGELTPAHGLISKRPQGVVADHKASPGPGDADDRDRRHKPGQPPTEAHHNAPQNEPENVEQKAQHRIIRGAPSLTKGGASAARTGRPQHHSRDG
jgi:hypothetical protein